MLALTKHRQADVAYSHIMCNNGEQIFLKFSTTTASTKYQLIWSIVYIVATIPCYSYFYNSHG